MKAGILKTVTDDDVSSAEYLEFGRYKCKITEKDGGKLVGKNKKLFMINQSNLYTHEELDYAKHLGLKITMSSKENNFLHYPRSHCLTGSQIFSGYINFLYKLKMSGVSEVKPLLTQLHSTLSRENKAEYVCEILDGETFIPKSDGVVEKIIPIGGNMYQITLEVEKAFKTDFARLGPFMMSKARLMMAKVVEPVVDNVHYSHTDSVISDIPLHEFQNAPELYKKDKGTLGEFRYEGCTDDNGFILNGTNRTKNDLFIL
jgi:hypothetical protein